MYVAGRGVGGLRVRVDRKNKEDGTGKMDKGRKKCQKYEKWVDVEVGGGEGGQGGCLLRCSLGPLSSKRYGGKFKADSLAQANGARRCPTWRRERVDCRVRGGKNEQVNE